jgi:hypothetical protein
MGLKLERFHYDSAIQETKRGINSIAVTNCFQHHVSRLELAGLWAVLSQQDGQLLMSFDSYSHYLAYCIPRRLSAIFVQNLYFFPLFLLRHVFLYAKARDKAQMSSGSAP